MESEHVQQGAENRICQGNFHGGENGADSTVEYATLQWRGFVL